MNIANNWFSYYDSQIYMIQFVMSMNETAVV